MNNKKSLRLFVVLCFLLPLSGAYALEGGASSYPSGIVTVMSGAVGAPGDTYLYTYNKRIDIASVRDAKGNKRFPKAKGAIHAHALRLVHTLDGPKLWGGDISVELAIPYLDAHMNIPALGAYERGQVSGIGDPFFGLMLSWNSPAYLHHVALDFVAPWGKYDKNALINAGSNAKVIYGAYAFTWFPVRQIEVSSKISLNYSFENTDTNYQSGIQLVADYGLNCRIAQNWLAGVGGYISTQLNDDKQFNDSVGNRSRSAKVGPQIGYASKGWGILLAYQDDVYARNTSSGDTLLLNGFLKF